MAASEDQNQLDSSANEDELEQYGVWVKAGPEDVEDSTEDESFGLANLEDSELEAAGQEFFPDQAESEGQAGAEAPVEELDIDMRSDDQAGGSSDDMDLEEISLDSLGDISPEQSADLTASDEEQLGSGLTLDLDEELDIDQRETPEEATGEGLLTLEEDDLTIGVDDEADELGVDLSPELATEPEPLQAEPVDIDDLEPVSLDDFGLSGTEGGSEAAPEQAEVSEPEPMPETVGADVELDSLGGTGDTEGILDDALEIDEELPDDLDDLSLDLDSLDETDELPSVESADDDLTLDLDSLDVDSFAEAAPGEVVAADEAEEADDLLADLSEAAEEEAELESADEESVVAEIETEEAFDIDSITEEAESDLEGIAIDVDLSDEEEIAELETDDLDLGEGFDDLGAVENEMSVEPAAASGPSVTADVGVGVSDDRLGNIERELAAIREEIRAEIREEIRNELGDLRRELAALRGSHVEPAATEDDEGRGFFEEEDEDEDETIALTGAELDNIMSTAEFTEETGTSPDIEDLGPIATDVQTPSAGAESPVQEITLDESEEDLGAIDLDLGGDLESHDTPAMAQMDIDAELADIDELEDSTESISLENIPDLEVDEVEPILDAEPIEPEEPAPAPEVSMEDAGAAMAGLAAAADLDADSVPDSLKSDLRDVLTYMDQLLESLPEEKIREFAASEHFKVYRRLFDELGLEQ